MTRSLLLMLAFSCLLGLSPVAGQIAVEILDVPPSVFSFEPIWVTFEVRNDGHWPLLVPADACSGQGTFLEVGWVGEPLEPPYPVYDCRSKRLVWLPPDGRRLFLQQVAPGARGTFEIEAVVRSRYRCVGSVIGAGRAQVEPAGVNEWGAWEFECWEGEARSQRAAVGVAVPTSDVDRAAAEFLELDHVRWRNSPRVSFMLRLKELVARFPTSHYTYAAYGFATRGQLGAMMAPVLLQPENPLNPWAAGAMAARFAYANRRCAPQESSDARALEELGERLDRVLAAHPPPGPVVDYLRQVELEYAAEDCGPGESRERQPQQ